MITDILILFIVITIILFFVSIFTMEDTPVISLPFITLGMIFSVLCTYGFWKVEYFYVGYNATLGNTTTEIYSTMNYGNPYSYIFMLMFFIFFILFFRAGFNMWKEALQTKGEMDYRTRDRRWR